MKIGENLTGNVLMNRVVLAALLLAATAALIMGATRGQSGDSRPVVYSPGTSEFIVSRTQIIELDDTVARFDSATGEIHVFHGDLQRPNVRGQWIRYVNGVRTSTSGILELQRPRGVRGIDALFLVDVVSGDTWLLRRRAAGRADWEPINVTSR